MATWKCKYCGKKKETQGEEKPDNNFGDDWFDCIPHKGESPGTQSVIHDYERQK